MKRYIFPLLIASVFTVRAGIFDDIGEAFESAGKEIEKGAKTVAKKTKKLAVSAGEEIEKGAKVAGKELEKGISAVEKELTKIGESEKPNPKYKAYNPGGSTSKNTLNVLAWNLYLRPRTLFKNGQFIRIRPGMIPKAIGRNYDVLILSEAFDNPVREELLKNLRALGYKYATGVVGKDGKNLSNGGVIIVSKYPITSSKEVMFGKTCLGTDCQADKGFMYAQINKNGRTYNVIGTHTQAWPEAKNAAVRNKQFDMIAKFIKDSKIPKSQAVIIGGDLNVDRIKYPQQHKEMLKRLRAAQPAFKGHKYTADGKINDLGNPKDPQEYLDYVLYSTDHAQPTSSSQTAIAIQAPKLWKEYAHESYNNALSDHFPVHGKFTFK